MPVMPSPNPAHTFMPLPVPGPQFTPQQMLLLGLLFVLLLCLAPILARLCCRLFGLERPNFRGALIPGATGIGFLIVAGCVYGPLAVLDMPLAASNAPLFLITALGFGLLGLLDDKWGSRDTGGFRGHLKALAAGRLTTGAIKLFCGGIVALAVGLLHEGIHAPLAGVLDGVIIALCANALNLLDVRPGRAQFGFLLLSLVCVVAVFRVGLAWAEVSPPPAVLLGPLILAAMLEWWPDSRGKAMMGDTGSNLLGAVAGLALITVLPFSGRFFLLAALLALNWLAEKVPLSQLIESNRALRAFDRQLGVR